MRWASKLLLLLRVVVVLGVCCGSSVGELLRQQ
jgi:hypothetical protein